MKDRKKLIATASLSALLLRGDLTSLQSEVYAATPLVEISMPQHASIVKAKTIREFNNIQYKDYIFENYGFYFYSHDNKDGTTTYTELTSGNTIVVNTDVYNKYEQKGLQEALFKIENATGSDEELSQASQIVASIIHEDPWSFMYSHVKTYNIDTRGKTFEQVYNELKNVKDNDEQSNEELKKEAVSNGALVHLREETKELPYDENWLIEKKDWINDIPEYQSKIIKRVSKYI
ncbi:hypothetical protein [Bacillus solimangrovi]|uniref:Uncharacterized protein n=1 Tax=Bacillus solimangrovi TaxID=1305675 RepID=A0A1E5LE66_9BACI|nr:hypothetical protein [Bacillus solimangrovi]OEH92352.1 hypothetical protein BFG57_16385 [Bacillus solimangrovi]